ncbi:MAG: outer membrane protein insertion porin family [Cellvibrionaceae bacterium]|jgi:outer membrane protein insertion porin family
MKSLLISLFLSFFFAVVFSIQLHASTYNIDDIRVLGLQRVSAGTVFSSIKIKANSQVTDEQLQDVIRDLFATELFDDITVGSDESVLVITVKERPVINTIIIEGNKIIEKEPLLEGLKSIGLAEGEVFKQSALQAISKQLNSQYSALGRYSAEIETLTRNVSQNQVIVGIRIDEGLIAKIKHINIVGNTHFDEDDLRDEFSLNTTGVWSWVSGNDKYAREKLAGDLERLKSFYLDRGYLKFNIMSTQVSLSPDKETVFITVNIQEGKRYSVDGVALAGDPVLPEREIKPLIGIKEGDVFSQLLVTRSEVEIKRRLGNEGYSAATVSGIPDINDENKTVKLTFFVRPGSISYVRRITFSGNTSTSDFVLRREMRQFEGAPVSSEKLELSKLRLQRLGLFGDVKIATKEVPGTTDQIDVEFTITEQPTASVNFSLGYSGGGGVTLGAGLQHNNWLGSGNTFGFNVETSETETSYNLNYNNPYYTADGVSRGIRLFYRKRDFDEISVSNYATDTVGLKVNFGYPISETGRLSFGVGVESITVEAGTTTAQEILGTPTLRDGVESAYVSNIFYETTILDNLGELENTVAQNIDIADTNNNGLLDEKDNIPSGATDAELENLIVTESAGLNPADGEYTEFDGDSPVIRDRSEGFLDQYGDSFNNLTFDLGWSDSTFDRGIFPTEGISQRFNMEVAVPGGDLEYYKLTYRSDIYFPISGKTTFHLRGRLGYGDGYGKLDGLPFFENFFSGGVSSVRGFESSSLGPKGTPSNAYLAVPVYLSEAGTPDLNDPDYVYVLAGGQLLTATNGDRDSFGGNVLVELSAELVLPIPFVKENDKARIALFVDSGNVFSTDCGPGQENCDNLDLAKLSVSGGISFQWLSPVGPLSFNFARPIVEQPFDETEAFQFSLGRSF